MDVSASSSVMADKCTASMKSALSTSNRSRSATVESYEVS
jgi:hypothetical protein